MIKIIQSSPPHTGSTLLINLVHGFLCPEEKIHWDTETLIDEFLVTKTHCININKLESKYPQYKLLFIMSERYDNKIKRNINNKIKTKNNVLVINYDKLLISENNTTQTLIDYIFNELNIFLPDEIKPKKSNNLIKKDMLNRLNIVNETVEKMKNKPFSEIDDFTSIHGSHRNRP